jgi:hypothetical protein
VCLQTLRPPLSALQPPLPMMVKLFRSLSLLLSVGAAYASLQIVPGATVTGVSQLIQH